MGILPAPVLVSLLILRISIRALRNEDNSMSRSIFLRRIAASRSLRSSCYYCSYYYFLVATYASGPFLCCPVVVRVLGGELALGLFILGREDSACHSSLAIRKLFAALSCCAVSLFWFCNFYSASLERDRAYCNY